MNYVICSMFCVNKIYSMKYAVYSMEYNNKFKLKTKTKLNFFMLIFVMFFTIYNKLFMCTIVFRIWIS